MTEQEVATENLDTQDNEVADIADTTNSKMIPIEAMYAEKRKRQELADENRYLREQLDKQKAPPAEEEDLDGIVTKGDLKKTQLESQFLLKREILEESFKENRPEDLKLIHENLKQIIEQKPWLAQSIESASNRYSRALEIVRDYMKPSQPKTSAKADRILENAMKPGSPANVGKTSPALDKVEYLKSIGGTKEFNDYRRKVLSQGR